MLTIEQLNSLTDLREKFQAVTGLTWDPTTIDDEDFLKKIQWYFPKGASLYKELIAFEKKVIEELGGGTSDPYYNEGEADEQSGGEQTSDEPKDSEQTGDAQGDSEQNTPNTQAKEGNYTTVDTVQKDTEE